MSETTDHLPAALQGTLDVMAGVLCLGLAALAIGYEASTALSAVAREHVETSMKVADWVGIGGMVFMAPYAYLLEWAERHNRLRAKFWRHLGWSFQGLLLAICVACTAGEHHYRLIPMAVSAVVTGAMAWAIWMREQLLPPEDQAIIDQLLLEQEVRQNQAVRAARQQRREERLQQIASRLQGPHAAATTAQQAVEVSYSWPIPEGKHEPLVYFIRNGDRVKIGTSTNVRARIRRLALRPEYVVLLRPGGQGLERAFHAEFASLRDGTTEWFRYAGVLAEFIAKANEAAKFEQGV